MRRAAMRQSCPGSSPPGTPRGMDTVTPKKSSMRRLNGNRPDTCASLSTAKPPGAPRRESIVPATRSLH